MQELLLVGLIDLFAAGLASIPFVLVYNLRRRRPEPELLSDRATSQPWARTA